MLTLAFFSPGVMISEIAHSFREWEAGHDSHKLRLHVGHDGSMIRLNALIGLGNITPLRWPGLGSEVIMEVSVLSRLLFCHCISFLYL
jgi:2-phosphoxylose phosphatase